MKGKKYVIGLGAVAIALLMVSTVTAVPQTQSKPVMDKIEQQETLTSQLMSIYNTLNAGGKLSAEEQQNLNIDATTELQKLYDEEGFLNHLVSDEVIQLLNEYYIAFVSDSSFQSIFNSDAIQQFIQTDGFIEFMNSDELQYVLDNFNPVNPTSQELLESQQIVEYILESSVYEQYVSSCDMEEAVATIESNQETVNSLSGVFSLDDAETCEAIGAIILMFILAIVLLILIGLITWIPAIIVAIVLYPIGWLCAWGSFMQVARECYGYGFPIISLALATLGSLIAGMIILGALVVWPLTCLIIIIAAASQFNPFPQFP